MEAVYNSYARLHSQLSQLDSLLCQGSVPPTCTLDILLSGAGAAATTLASLSLHSLSAATSLKSNPIPCTKGRLLRGLVACDTVKLLLKILLCGLRQGHQLVPSLLHHLIQCATAAVSLAAQAARLLYDDFAVADKPPDRRDVASMLADACTKIFDAAAQPAVLVQHLPGRRPASSRLRAIACAPEWTSALCHQLAPILQWCVEERVATSAALKRLSYLLE
ncbi:hypothetical protein N2152v2_010536 [Parachlorella kessleri]